MNYLCDTNIISELVRRRPNPGALRWAESVRRIFISVITLEEIHYGLAWKRNRRVEEWFDDFIREGCETLPVSEKTAHLAGHLRGRLQSQGKPRSQADMLIAATALEHEMTLVTANTRDFADCEVALLNPLL